MTSVQNPRQNVSLSQHSDDMEQVAVDSAQIVHRLVKPRQMWYLWVKSAIDFVLAVVLLAVLGPIILAAAAIIKLTSKGPAFYVQKRLGKNGTVFTMVKLRTMVHDAESGTGPVWAKLDDPRVTRVGNFLRKTQIDEFPQLINVLFGQMSLIGPRPERPEIANRLQLDIPDYSQRVQVRPGITGLAQLSLPADTDLESVRRKLVQDLYYVRNISLRLDLRIFAFTAIYFVGAIARFFWSMISLPTWDVSRERLHREFNDSTASTLKTHE